MLNVHVCRVLASVSKRSDSKGLHAEYIEASSMPTCVANKKEILVLQGREGGKWVHSFAKHAAQKLAFVMKALKDHQPSLMASSSSHGSDHGGAVEDNNWNVLVNFWSDPRVDLVIDCPGSVALPMSLPLAATMISVMINRPVNQNVALFGLVLRRLVYSGMESTFIDYEAIIAMRKADPPVTHLFLAESVDFDVNKIKSPATTKAIKHGCKNAPPMRVTIIKKVSDLLDPQNRDIIFGAPWPRPDLKGDDERIPVMMEVGTGPGTGLVESDGHGSITSEVDRTVEDDSQVRVKEVVKEVVGNSPSFLGRLRSWCIPHM